MIRWGRAKRNSWERRTRQEQVEASTRWMLFGAPWCFYIGGMPQLSFSVTHAPLPLTLVAVLLALGLVQCALSVGGLRQGLDHYLGEGPAPTKRLRIMLVAGAPTIAALATLVALGDVHKVSAPAMVLFGTFTGITNVYALTVPPRHAAKVLTCAVLGLAVLLWAVGMRLPDLVGMLIVGVVFAILGVFTPRSSGWYLAVMREVDEAKQVQARLAVAEERLRFSRDLHDVVGRNLSVIALKSELAAQLARRGAAGSESAVAQMTEVQRIARESQTEVREVVRGYREAGLHTELAGARGVLRAAGVDCRIEEMPGEEIPDEVQSALGWVVREGATNVLRHAEATRCVVRVGTTSRDGGGCRDGGGSGNGADEGGDGGDVRREDGGRGRHVSGEGGGADAVLVMENDGVREPRTAGGSGLPGLRERLAPLGGTLSVERDESAGVFRLRAEIPLGKEPAPARTNSGAGAAAGEGIGENGERRATNDRRNGYGRHAPVRHGTEHPDAGPGEGQHTDGQFVDGERSNGQFIDGERSNGQFIDGERSSGQFVDGERSDAHPRPAG